MSSTPTAESADAPALAGTNAVPPPGALLTELRVRTFAAHDAVERLPAMAVLTSPVVTLADYRGYLREIARIYGSLEPPHFAALRAYLPSARRIGPPPNLGLRPKWPVLVAELDAQALPLPKLAELPEPPDLSSAIGGLYVLEGATLGGRVIARHLRRYLPVPIPAGSLMDFHGEGASAHWKALGAALDELMAQGLIDPERAVAAALGAFELVTTALASVEPVDPLGPLLGGD